MEKILKSVLSVLMVGMELLAFGADDAIPLKDMWDTNRLYTAEMVDSKISQAVEGGDYNTLTNKPSIGGVVLEGNKTASALGLQPTIADYTTTGAVQNIVEGYGYATETAVAGALNGKQDKLPYATNAIPQGAVSGLSTAKWALSNVTNASGGAVTAADVGAVGGYDYKTSPGTPSEITYSLYSTTNDTEFGSGPAIIFDEDGRRSEYPYLTRTRVDRYGITQLSYSQDSLMYNAAIRYGALYNGFGVEWFDGSDYYSVLLPPGSSSGYFAIESWASLSRTLNDTASNSTNKAACAEALKKITESEPHFAIIDGEVHIISITETED